MKLDEFISETIKSIIKGVSESQKYASENGAIVNPNVSYKDIDNTMVSYLKDRDGASKVYNIDFDISVVTSENKEKEGGASINVYSLKAGGGVSKKENNENISKINFSVNIVLPTINEKQ